MAACPENSEEWTDSWGAPFRKTCSAAGAEALSVGPDGKLGTPDDIHARCNPSGEIVQSD